MLDDILALRPATRSLQFVHLARIPAAIVERVRTLAHQRGIDFEPVAVSSVRAAAQAIERLKTSPAAATLVWFHKGVLGLNPDVLVPNLVRVSWAKRLPVVADEVDYVRRGILLTVTHDYRALGRRAAKLLAAREPGLVYSTATRRILNGRTTAVMGIRFKADDERRFDYVHE